MTSNLKKYKEDIDKLIRKGEKLLSILKNNEDLKKFRDGYEIWYSEALSLVEIVLPSRAEDFKKYYHQKGEDSLWKYINNEIGVNWGRPLFENQLGIVKSTKKRFESSLFDIKQLVQADLFDSELDTARELNKKGFTRGAGAIVGVVLEGHLLQVCKNHKIKVTKKKPTINDYNQLLKDNDVIEMKDWRFIQHLADLRNLCDHKKKREPKKEEVEELIDGVEKITKTIF